MAMAVKSRTVCFFFLVIVLLIIAGCSGGYDTGTGLYEGEGITISFPSGWEKGKRIPNATLTVESPDKSAQISLFIQELPENTTLEQYLKRVSSNMRRVGAQQKDTGPINIGGYEGLWTQRAIKVGGQTFESIAYYVMPGNRVYSIIATTDQLSYERWEPTFDEVAKSITFKD
jgi:hypothetical protein